MQWLLGVWALNCAILGIPTACGDSPLQQAGRRAIVLLITPTQGIKCLNHGLILESSFPGLEGQI